MEESDGGRKEECGIARESCVLGRAQPGRALARDEAASGKAEAAPPQTVKRSADVCRILARAAVLLLVVLAAARASAQSTGELHRGMLISRGWYAIAYPPIQTADGKRVVMVSAPEDEWIVTQWGPWLTVGECEETRSEVARGGLLPRDYEAFKEAGSPRAAEGPILADVQKRNARCIVSDGSERFRLPGRIEADPASEYVR